MLRQAEMGRWARMWRQGSSAAGCICVGGRHHKSGIALLLNGVCTYIQLHAGRAGAAGRLLSDALAWVFSEEAQHAERLDTAAAVWDLQPEVAASLKACSNLADAKDHMRRLRLDRPDDYNTAVAALCAQHIDHSELTTGCGLIRRIVV